MMSTKEEHVILNKIKDLGIHEIMNIDSDTYVRRVPGGLIYVTTVRTGASHMGGSGISSKSVTSTFVPFSGSIKWTEGR